MCFELHDCRTAYMMSQLQLNNKNSMFHCQKLKKKLVPTSDCPPLKGISRQISRIFSVAMVTHA